MAIDKQVEHTSVKTYLLVFVGLAILTAATVTVSYLGLPHHLAIAAAGLIAFAKIALIATFFMHLKYEKIGIGAFIAVAFFFIGAILFTLIPDIGRLR